MQVLEEAIASLTARLIADEFFGQYFGLLDERMRSMYDWISKTIFAMSQSITMNRLGVQALNGKVAELQHALKTLRTETKHAQIVQCDMLMQLVSKNEILQKKLAAQSSRHSAACKHEYQKKAHQRNDEDAHVKQMLLNEW